MQPGPVLVAVLAVDGVGRESSPFLGAILPQAVAFAGQVFQGFDPELFQDIFSELEFNAGDLAVVVFGFIPDRGEQLLFGAVAFDLQDLVIDAEHDIALADADPGFHLLEVVVFRGELQGAFGLGHGDAGETVTIAEGMQFVGPGDPVAPELQRQGLDVQADKVGAQVGLRDAVLDDLTVPQLQESGDKVNDFIIAGAPAGSRADVYPDVRGEQPVLTGRDKEIDVGPGQVEAIAALAAVAVAVVVVIVVRAEPDRDLAMQFLGFCFGVGQDIEKPR